MAGVGQATFVGFGFGAIQAGLFLLEAQRSGAFDRLVVAEIVPDAVDAVRRAGGRYHVNVAHADHVEDVAVGPVQIENPVIEADRVRLVDAIAAAQEMATAVPTTRAYGGEGPGSLQRVLAAGLQRKIAIDGPPAVVYAAENDPHAAAKLEAAVLAMIPPGAHAAVAAKVRFGDTVIGKMSGIIAPPDTLDGLTPITPDSDRAFLVEAFNRILVARPGFGADVSFRRGLTVFVEQDDLRPFEDTKFFTHNATHALGAYLGQVCGLVTMDQLVAQPGMLPFLRAAMLEEVGPGLRARYAGRDALFSAAGFAAYVDDLLARMTNPYLRDQVARVARDPARKLGWADRLLGAMRLAHGAGVPPQRYALGAAAALLAWDAETEPTVLLPSLWQTAQPDPEEAVAMVALIQVGCQRLSAWRAAGCPDLSAWWAAHSTAAAQP